MSKTRQAKSSCRGHAFPSPSFGWGRPAAAQVNVLQSQNNMVDCFKGWWNHLHSPRFAVLLQGFVNFPGLTADIFRRYSIFTQETARGHLDRPEVARNQPSSPSISSSTSSSMPKEQTQVDPTGRFPLTSKRGNQYVLIMFCEDSNYTHAVPVPNRSDPIFAAAFLERLRFFTNNNNKMPTNGRFDNEFPPKVRTICEKNSISFQLARQAFIEPT